MNNTTSATCRAGSGYPSRAHEIKQGYGVIPVA